MRTATANRDWTALIRRLAAMLAMLCALGVTLASAPAAHAGLVYSNVGSFDQDMRIPFGVAVDQQNEHVYVADLLEGVLQYEASGSPLSEPFTTGFSRPAGVAVDPQNENVYIYEAERQEIYTFEPQGAGPPTELGHFSVTGGQFTFVQIASDAAGDIYYPNQAENTVQEFSPSGALLNTFSGGSVGAFSAPQGVAVDSSGDVFVADGGNGRVVEIAGSSGQPDPTGAQSVLDSGGSQDVAVDPVSGDVFVLDLNSEGSCTPLSPSEPCDRVRAFHTGETTPFAEFGAGTIGTESFPDHLAVDHSTGNVYVSDNSNAKVWIFQPVIAPTVTTEAATGVNGTEATLHGVVNPEGTQTAYHFEYGTSTAYGKSVPVPEAALGDGTQAIPVSQPISGLEGSTTYHFRVVANAGGGIIIDGADETFTTEAASPAIVGESVSGVTRGDALLEALVNPENQETTYHFEYATNPQLTGTTVLGSTSIPPEGQTVPVGPVDIGGGLTPGVTYYYRVVAEDATPPATDGPVQSFTTIGKPLVTTGVAADFTRTSATVSGTVDPVGAESAYHYVYIDQAGYETALAEGASDPYSDGQSTVAVRVAAGYATEVAGPVVIGGLLPGGTYHYALVANNEVGETIGIDETFTAASPSPPLVSTGTASGVSINAASISATIETGGSPAIYGFEIGTEAGVYGPATGLGSVGAGLTETVTLSLQDLQPGTTYHYRIEASNVDGVAHGADGSFTTPGFPVLLTSLMAEPLIATPAVVFPTEAASGTPPAPKTLTRAQKLTNALKACRRDKRKEKRASCERAARKTFGAKKKT
jgi:NHL repeat